MDETVVAEEPKKKNSLGYDLGKNSVGMIAGLFATVVAERAFEAFMLARKNKRTTTET